MLGKSTLNSIVSFKPEELKYWHKTEAKHRPTKVYLYACVWFSQVFFNTTDQNVNLLGQTLPFFFLSIGQPFLECDFVQKQNSLFFPQCHLQRLPFIYFLLFSMDEISLRPDHFHFLRLFLLFFRNITEYTLLLFIMHSTFKTRGVKRKQYK